MNMKIVILFVFMLIGTIMGQDDNTPPPDDCNACGPECAPACGTKNFKTCCYNYLRRHIRSIKLQEEDPPEEY